MTKSYTLAQLAEHLGAVLQGESDYLIHGLATLQNADASCVSFVANPAYQKYLATSQAGAVVIRSQLATSFAGNKLLVDDAYLAYARLSSLFENRVPTTTGIHPSAVVHPSVELGKDVRIGANVVIGAQTSLGDEVEIGSGVVVGEDCTIDARTRLAANVTVYHGVVMGADCIIHSGAVIGADGFGFAREGLEWVKIQQLGSVVIGNRVEVGANTTVDRGALGDTVLADGVKLDNLIQIGHNVRLGKNTAIAAHTAIAGSTTVGKDCTVAGCVGISGHLTIADNVHITGMSMVSASITEAGSYSSGTPLASTREWRKNAVRFRQLEKMALRLRSLEQNGKDS